MYIFCSISHKDSSLRLSYWGSNPGKTILTKSVSITYAPVITRLARTGKVTPR